MTRFFASHDGKNGFRCAPYGKVIVTDSALYTYGVVNMGFENAESTMRHLVHISRSMNTFSTYQIALIVLFVVMVNIDLEKMSACSKMHKCLLDILRDKLIIMLRRLEILPIALNIVAIVRGRFAN